MRLLTLTIALAPHSNPKQVPPNTVSTPRHFRDNGYLTLGLGKGFHQGNQSGNSLGCWNAQNVWTPNDAYPCYPYTGGSCPHGGEGGGHCVQEDSEMRDIFKNHNLDPNKDVVRARVFLTIKCAATWIQMDNHPVHCEADCMGISKAP